MTATDRDRGSVMPMTTVLIAFLMFGAWSLISATQQWGVRRDVQGVAAAAARAGAQGDQSAIRSGNIVDPGAATTRAQSVIATAGYTGSVAIDGQTVTVTVTGAVDYAFPAPGFPATIAATASAEAITGVTGEETGP